jgi:hypothetical protein
MFIPTYTKTYIQNNSCSKNGEVKEEETDLLSILELHNPSLVVVVELNFTVRSLEPGTNLFFFFSYPVWGLDFVCLSHLGRRIAFAFLFWEIMKNI